MLNDIFSFLKSLVSAPKQETSAEFIEKFARATPLTYEEVDRMKDDLRLTTPKAVHATLLVHVYGIHLALLGTAARKLVQHANRAAFETAILSRYIDASLKKLGVGGNAHGLYQEMSHQMKEMDGEFYANANDTNGPFFAVTKRFLRIISGKDSTDIAGASAIICNLPPECLMGSTRTDIGFDREGACGLTLRSRGRCAIKPRRAPELGR